MDSHGLISGWQFITTLFGRYTCCVPLANPQATLNRGRLLVECWGFAMVTWGFARQRHGRTGSHLQLKTCNEWATKLNPFTQFTHLIFHKCWWPTFCCVQVTECQLVDSCGWWIWRSFWWWILGLGGLRGLGGLGGLGRWFHLVRDLVTLQCTRSSGRCAVVSKIRVPRPCPKGSGLSQLWASSWNTKFTQTGRCLHPDVA